MDTVIAIGDRSVATPLSASLEQLGIARPEVFPGPNDHFYRYLGGRTSARPVLVFLGSSEFDAGFYQQISTARELGGERVKVVACGAHLSPSQELRAIRSGAVDCLDVHANLAQDLRVVFERIDAASKGTGLLGRLFVIVGATGGVGTSFVASNLSAALARGENDSCALIDMHLRGGDIASLFAVTPRHTLLSLSEKMDQLDRIMFGQSLVPHASGVHILASPHPFSNYRAISADAIQRIVTMARQSHQNVVVDAEDCEHPEQVRTLAGSTNIVVPFRLDIVSLKKTKTLIQYLIQANVPQRLIKVVANRSNQAKELPLGRVQDILEMPIAIRIPDAPAAVNESVNLGAPLVAMYPKHPVSLAFSRLADTLLGREAPAESEMAARRLLPAKVAALLGYTMFWRSALTGSNS